ncbi:MAG: hypothetical protein JSV34_01720 [Candidatus Omnitrophota bacterium]|nr:MAG: hypothetical protein JSV34_01720 [Candidatus Omnitrophota bacterium]
MNKGFSLILIVFIIVITAVVIVGGYNFLIFNQLKAVGFNLGGEQALYIAEAGIERTMEYLEDDTNWSDNTGTSVLTEDFGAGSYDIDLTGGSRTKITVTCESVVDAGHKQVSRKIRQQIRRLPEAFNYALFWEGAGSLDVNQGAVNVNGGDVFTKDTVSSTGAGAINVPDGGTPSITNGGFVYTAASWTAAGTYTEGTKPDDEPAYPVLDTTFYDDEIITAEAQAAGDLILTGGTYTVSGTTYVNGEITISGVTVTGSGALVATQKINIKDSTSITPDSGGFIRFISKGDVTIEASTTATGTLVYARSESEIDNATVTGAFISSDKVKLTNGTILTGYIYTSEASLSDTATINGSVVTDSFENNEISALGRTVTINYDHSYLEEAAPGLGLDIDGDANEEGIIVKVPGTWEQI